MRDAVLVMRQDLKTMQRFSVDQVKSICESCELGGYGPHGNAVNEVVEKEAPGN